MTRAYYNEHDKGAAAWLRELIKAGLIAYGDVDERSIEDVLPNDLKSYTQCHFFAGVGVWSYALRQAGWADDRPVWTGSCPCQPFSAAGKGAAFDDERHLWPAFHHLIAQCKPPAIFGEQVASKDADTWLDLVQDDLEGMGYAVGAVPFPSAGVGAPHIRDRLYWVADSNLSNRRAGSSTWNLGNRNNAGRKEGSSNAEGCCKPSGLAYPNGRDAGTEREQCCGQQRQQPEDGGLVRLGNANSESAGWNAGGACGAQTQVDGAHACDSHGPWNAGDDILRLADSEQHDYRCKTESSDYVESQSNGPADRAGGCGCASGGMADVSVCGRREECSDGGRSGSGDSAQGIAAGLVHGCADLRPGPTNGYWRDADWIGCTDAKWRPVEPGTFPLVDGVAKGMVPSSNIGLPIDANQTGEARVMRLRGYGNAINAEAATEFVVACLGAMA